MGQHRQTSKHHFGGENGIAELIQTQLLSQDRTDWSNALGSIETWPESLKTALNVLFHVPCPMLLVWGGDRILFYNAAYSAIADQSQSIPCGQSLKRQKIAPWSGFTSQVNHVFSTGGLPQAQLPIHPDNLSVRSND